MHRVRADRAATTSELDLDNDKVVDVFQVVADGLLGQPRVNPSNNEVPRGARADLAGDMRTEDELAVAPTDLDLAHS